MSQWFHFGLNGSVDEIKPRVSVGNPSFMIHKRHLIRNGTIAHSPEWARNWEKKSEGEDMDLVLTNTL